jgi:glycosyltransferase involved in cell wall biosynthesis
MFVRRSDKPNRHIRILVLSGAWPVIAGATRGAEIALYEMLRLLAAEGDIQVAYTLAATEEVPQSDQMRAGMATLAAAGVRFLPPIRFDYKLPASPLRRSYQRLFSNISIPGLGQDDKIVAACQGAEFIPDAVLTVWSDLAAAAASSLPWPVFAYCGNPYHKVVLANLRLQWQWERRRQPSWLARHALERLIAKRIEQLHVRSMRRLAFVGDVHANDVAFYRSVGVAAHYLRSMWPSVDHADWRCRREAAEQLSPLKIAASVASVPSTGNTFGLLAIGQEVLPALRRQFGADAFELHIYGAGVPRPFLKSLLNDPAVKLRGFVDDLDAEIYSCPIYLVANNRYFYKAGHNRFLHAWSLGACIVTWRDSAIAMPELVHDHNVLLAKSADEMTELIAGAAANKALRRRLGAAGRATVQDYYRPETIVAELVRRIRNWRSQPGAGNDSKSLIGAMSALR